MLFIFIYNKPVNLNIMVNKCSVNVKGWHAQIKHIITFGLSSLQIPIEDIITDTKEIKVQNISC